MFREFAASGLFKVMCATPSRTSNKRVSYSMVWRSFLLSRTATRRLSGGREFTRFKPTRRGCYANQAAAFLGDEPAGKKTK
jgi:hypothetical protein